MNAVPHRTHRPALHLDKRGLVWLLAVAQLEQVPLELWLPTAGVWTATPVPSMEDLPLAVPGVCAFGVSQSIGCRGVTSGVDLLDGIGTPLGRIVPQRQEPAIWPVLLLASLAR